MARAPPVQVCAGLIKKCLCASCLPSARFIIKSVVGWGGVKGLLGLPIYEAALMNEEGPCCSSCQTLAFLFVKGALQLFLKLAYCPVSVPTHPPSSSAYILLMLPPSQPRPGPSQFL